MSLEVRGRLTRGDVTLDIDLDLPTGVCAVTGENGAGKTTFLRLLAGLERLDEGRLVLDGTVLDDPAPDDPANATFVPAHERPVATVFQDHRLLPHLSALDNVAFGPRRVGASRTEATHRARALLTEFGLATVAAQRPDRLSVGQRQRVAIARGVARPARLRLLDEPLASIDEPSRDAMRRTMCAGVAHVVWVSHDPADAIGCDTRIAVADGRVRQTRTP